MGRLSLSSTSHLSSTPMAVPLRLAWSKSKSTPLFAAAEGLKPYKQGEGRRALRLLCSIQACAAARGQTTLPAPGGRQGWYKDAQAGGAKFKALTPLEGPSPLDVTSQKASGCAVFNHAEVSRISEISNQGFGWTGILSTPTETLAILCR